MVQVQNQLERERDLVTVYTVVIRHGLQQYSGRLWRLNNAQLVPRGSKCAMKNIPHTITTPSPARTVDTRPDPTI